MYSRPEVTVSTQILDLQNDRLARSPALLNTAFERATRRLRSQFIAELSTRKKPHDRPTDWETPKQRRWWWAVGVFISKAAVAHPSKGWRTDVKTEQAGGLFRYWNVVPQWVYVQGEQVQRMHKNVWAQTSDVAPKYAALAETVLTETWRTVVDPVAGVRP